MSTTADPDPQPEPDTDEPEGDVDDFPRPSHVAGGRTL